MLQQQQHPVNTEPTTSTGKGKGERKRKAKEFLAVAVRIIGRLWFFAVTMKWKDRLVIGIVGLAILSVVALHIVSVVQMRSEAKATVVSSPSTAPSMPSFEVANPDVPALSSTTTTSTNTPTLTLTSTMATGAAVGAATTAASSGNRTTTTATGTASAVTQPPVATVAVAPLLVPLGQVGKPHVVGEYGVLIEKAVLICYQHHYDCPSDAVQPNVPVPATTLSTPAPNQEPEPKFIVGVQVNVMSYQGSYYKKKVVAGAVTSLHFLTLTTNANMNSKGSGSNSSQSTLPAPTSDPRLFYLEATPPTQANPPASDFRLLTPVEVATLNSQLPAGARRSPVLDLTESGQGAKKELSFGESLSGWLFFEYEYKPNPAATSAANGVNGGNPLLLDPKSELEFRFYSNPATSHTSGIPLRVRIAASQLTILARF